MPGVETTLEEQHSRCMILLPYETEPVRPHEMSGSHYLNPSRPVILWKMLSFWGVLADNFAAS